MLHFCNKSTLIVYPYKDQEEEKVKYNEYIINEFLQLHIPSFSGKKMFGNKEAK
jgi:hypothetical protein